jgi:hypothetical protein
MTRRYVPILHEGMATHIRHETAERFGIRRDQPVNGTLWAEVWADHSRLERDYLETKQ